MHARSLATWSCLSFALLPSLAAQVPFERFVVSVTGTTRESSAYFVDARTGDLTPVLGLPVSRLLDFKLVAIDPASGSILSAANLLALNASFLDSYPLSGRTAGKPARITWTQPKGTAIRDARVVPGGNVVLGVPSGLWLAPLAGGAATLLGSLPNTEAVVADGQFAFVLTRSPGLPSTIWRYDFSNSSFVQVVANLPEARSFDTYPAAPLFLVGTQAGDLYLVDTVSGQGTLFRNVGTSPIVALRRSVTGEVLLAEQTGRLFSLASLPSPIATIPGTPTDIDTGTNPAAAFFTFGKSCAGSSGFEPEMGSSGVPSLGNPSFAFTVAKALGGAPAVFAMGYSRRTWGAVALPLDLAPLGAPGCAVRVNGIMLGATVLGGSGPGGGTGSFVAPIPNQSALTGMVLACQWWCLDLAGNALGLTTSDGGEAIIR